MTGSKPKKPAPLVIGGEEVVPGEVAYLDLAVARLPTTTKISIPVVVVHGHRPGPILWLSAAVHGDELNGIEVIHQVLEKVQPGSLCGALIAVPIVNVFGFIHQSRYLPDGRDLNRVFPGSATGSLAARMAKLFMDEIVGHCTHGIDLHTGSRHRTNLPQIRANLDDEETRDLATAFAAPVTLHARGRDGSLRSAAVERKIPNLLFEAGEPQRFDEDAIRTGVRGVLRLMGHLKMLRSGVPRAGRLTMIMRKSGWVRARRAGLLRLQVAAGDTVRKGQAIGTIGDPFGGERAVVKSTADGIVVGHTKNPVVYQGDALVHVAS